MTAEDLSAISSLLDSKLDPIKSDIAELKTDVAGLKTDVAGLKADMVTVKADIAELKEKQDVTNVALNELLAWADAAGKRIELEFLPAGRNKQY